MVSVLHNFISRCDYATVFSSLGNTRIDIAVKIFHKCNTAFALWFGHEIPQQLLC